MRGGPLQRIWSGTRSSHSPSASRSQDVGHGDRPRGGTELETAYACHREPVYGGCEANRRSRMGSAAEDGADGGCPPARASVSGRRPIGVEAIRDLSEADPGVAGVADPLDDVRRHRRRSADSLWLTPRPRRAAPLREHSLELIGRDQPRPGRSLDRLDVGQHAVRERRSPDAERLRCLGPRVASRSTWDASRTTTRGESSARGDLLATGSQEWGSLLPEPALRVALRSGGLAPETAARHAYTVHKPGDGSAPWCICLRSVSRLVVAVRAVLATGVRQRSIE